MCGIFGHVAHSPHPERSHTGAALRSLARRGPDCSRSWMSRCGRLQLAHARLAIVDLSSTGMQPMTSRDGRWTVTMNGEIYNHRQLRADLLGSGHRLRGTSDTEVFLELVAVRGIRAALDAADGMWAFAAWDSYDRRLWLCRDRFGEKPLYIADVGDGLSFASDLCALRDAPGFDRDIDTGSVAELLRFGSVVAPATIYRSAVQLPPGTLAAWQIPEFSERSQPRLTTSPTAVVTYWSAAQAARDAADSGRNNYLTRRPEPTIARAERTAQALPVLRRAVSQRCDVDVPIGALLSGGVDSTLVAALMREHLGRSFPVFTVGFDDARFDETGAASSVARRLGLDHHVRRMTAVDARTALDVVPSSFSEPLADASVLCSLVVAELAREHCSVVLTGDGGDELFAGYTRYDAVQRLARLRGLLSGRRSTTWLAEAVRRRASRGRIGSRIGRAAGAVAAATPDDAYWEVMAKGNWPRTGRPMPEYFDDRSSWSLAERCQLADTSVFLPNGPLAKMDRATMHFGLEARAAYLSPSVHQIAWSADDRFTRRPPRKPTLLDTAAVLLPGWQPTPKRGFEVPLDEWLCGGLRGWAEELLTPSMLASSGAFDHSEAALLADLWRRARVPAREIWPLITFQWWHETVHLGSTRG